MRISHSRFCSFAGVTTLLALVVLLGSIGCTPLTSSHGREVTSSHSRVSGDGIYHTVRAGETLWRISKTYGVSVSEVVEANDLESYIIQPGQKLLIPGASKERGVPAAQVDTGPAPDAELAWPLAGRGRGSVTSGFGPRKHPTRKTDDFHKGIDIDGAREERVLAAAAGEVVFAGTMTGYGTVVMIDHGNRLITVYAHLSRAAVKLEDKVAVGEAIGYIGTTGTSTGSHLHFEVRHRGRAVDPLGFLP
ncbi:M23 family metallopeptidase [bacterium]|nr:M23 family metallopeptidase [bacterium]